MNITLGEAASIAISGMIVLSAALFGCQSLVWWWRGRRDRKDQEGGEG
ncbi:MAG TPA: hypothetical protein VMV29_05005 [Ktedonobacterales bacterium]|nr:hypothetical protein [Ktedonobacterales bacterium]